MTQSTGLQVAGEVLIERVKLVSSQNVIVDLIDFMVEIDLYEDIYLNYLHGKIVITDSRNLIDALPIIGEEYLMLKIRTPGFDQVIEKTFRVFKCTDRVIVRDNNTQNYILHFASIELFYDILLPLYIPFEGDVHSIVGSIFEKYIATSRNYEISQTEDDIKNIEKVTPLVILNETANKVKFVSPGWTPFKCINWLASRSIPKNSNAKNYLFFETNKAFYFGSLEHIFKDAYENNNYIGEYSTGISNIRDGKKVVDVNREMFLASDVSMSATTDHIKNYTSGYLANRLIELDVINKQYQVFDYDYINEYKNQFHTSGKGEKSVPAFTSESLRNPVQNTSYYPKNPGLFDNFIGNVNERMGEIHGNRKSSLTELSNIKINITVPGRTDAEVGNLFRMLYPALGADPSKLDRDYSGFYLITAICHRINRMSHTMHIEGVKDSLRVDINE